MQISKILCFIHFSINAWEFAKWRESLDTGKTVDKKSYDGPKIISSPTNKEKFESLHTYSFKILVNMVQQNLGFSEADIKKPRGCTFSFNLL